MKQTEGYLPSWTADLTKVQKRTVTKRWAQAVKPNQHRCSKLNTMLHRHLICLCFGLVPSQRLVLIAKPFVSLFWFSKQSHCQDFNTCEIERFKRYCISDVGLCVSFVFFLSKLWMPFPTIDFTQIVLVSSESTRVFIHWVSALTYEKKISLFIFNKIRCEALIF